MDDERIESALTAAEVAVAAGGGVEGTGFWKAVSAARNDEALAARYGDRIARIDRRAFENGVRLRIPAAAGTALLTAGTVAGLAALASAPGLDRRLLRSAVFLGAFGALELSTHSLAHWAVGRAMGMRFTHYFLGGPPPPRPGAKLDYGTYLRVPPRRRALMHASGAVVTKVVPFAMIPAARSADLYSWVIPLLLVVGAGQIVTDAVFSTKASDWKKVKRELASARRWKAAA